VILGFAWLIFPLLFPMFGLFPPLGKSELLRDSILKDKFYKLQLP
jgi:hypothetical protein